MINTYEEYVNLIREGLIITHRISKYKHLIENYLDRNNIKFEIDVNSTNDTFKLTLYEKELNSYESIISLINNIGYFPSSIKVFRNIEDSNNEKYQNFKYNFDTIKDEINNEKFIKLTLSCEALFDYEVLNLPPIIYHIYPSKYLDKILNIGLIPKSRIRKSYHPERCYFTYSIIDANNLIKEFQLNDIKDNIGPINYSILKIDSSDMKNKTNDKDIKFFIDPNSVGFYTYDNINPSFIIYP